jgi:hypothetical protein
MADDGSDRGTVWSQRMADAVRGKPRKPSDTIASMPAKIRTQQLPDTSVQRYRYADLIRSCISVTRYEDIISVHVIILK